MPRARLAAACLAAGAVLAATAPAAHADDGTLPLLRQQLAADLSGSTAGHLAARFDVAGVGSVDLGGDAMQRPASNQKIFTATTALLLLGPDFRFATSVTTDAAAVRSDGLLAGNLVITGSGDPSLNRWRLEDLALALHKAGVRRVTGGVYVDDTRFSPETNAPGWQPDFFPGELGPVSAFAVDRDEWGEGDAYMTDPAPQNATLWWAALKKAGIAVVGGLHVGQAPKATTVLATDRSDPLSELVKHMLKHSDNFYAEMLLRAAGAAYTGYGTRDTGVAAVEAVARRLHVPLGTVVDGSGLSYLDQETPGELVAWLSAAATTKAGPALSDGMPASCQQPGTLKYRLCGAWLTGRVHAKTGTLTGVRTLSGYTTTRTGQRVTFSVLMSDVRDPWTAEQAADAAVARLARLDVPASALVQPTPAAAPKKAHAKPALTSAHAVTAASEVPPRRPWGPPIVAALLVAAVAAATVRVGRRSVL